MFLMIMIFGSGEGREVSSLRGSPCSSVACPVPGSAVHPAGVSLSFKRIATRMAHVWKGREKHKINDPR